jgi:hypothetical protein
MKCVKTIRNLKGKIYRRIDDDSGKGRKWVPLEDGEVLMYIFGPCEYLFYRVCDKGTRLSSTFDGNRLTLKQFGDVSSLILESTK